MNKYQLLEDDISIFSLLLANLSEAERGKEVNLSPFSVSCLLIPNRIESGSLFLSVEGWVIPGIPSIADQEHGNLLLPASEYWFTCPNFVETERRWLTRQSVRSLHKLLEILEVVAPVSQQLLPDRGYQAHFQLSLKLFVHQAGSEI